MAAFYRATVADFLAAEPAALMLRLTTGVVGMGFDLRADQHSAWLEQARILQQSLTQLSQQMPTASAWGLLLEYQIPGRPKRLDAVLLDGAGIIAIVQSRCGGIPRSRQMAAPRGLLESSRFPPRERERADRTAARFDGRA